MRTSKTLFCELNKNFYYSNLMLLILKESKGDEASPVVCAARTNEVHVHASHNFFLLRQCSRPQANSDFNKTNFCFFIFMRKYLEKLFFDEFEDKIR